MPCDLSLEVLGSGESFAHGHPVSHLSGMENVAKCGAFGSGNSFLEFSVNEVVDAAHYRERWVMMELQRSAISRVLPSVFSVRIWQRSLCRDWIS